MKIGIHGSEADRELAEQIGDRLKAGLRMEVRRETGGRFVDVLGAFWDADFVVVLLSKDTAPARWVREEWQRALWEEPEENGSRVLCVLTGDCRHPELMERRRPRYRFLDARGNSQPVVGALREWIMEARRGDQPRRFLPGDDVSAVDAAVLEAWRENAVEMPGIVAAQGPAGAGKTDLALEFVRRFYLEFEDVVWVSCAGRSAAETTGDVASLLGMKLTAGTEVSCSRLRKVMKDRRLLLVLDGADRVGHLELLPEGGWTSAVVTSRMEMGEFEPVVLPKRHVVGTLEPFAACRKDALWPAVLHRMGLPLEGLQWLDRQGGWMRVPGPVAGKVPLEWGRKHAEAALSLAREDAGEQILPDLFLAVRRLLERGDLASAAELARRGERISRLAHRMPEQVEMLRLVSEAAWDKGDTAICDAFARDLVPVLEDMGDVDEARMWHARISRESGQQMMLPMEMDV
ncbi:MAG: TIR domain-containing protein [Acidobacteria bacterium]|nr:TIR domain-containing protein [Acidobacteriota bacterium]